jgi:hypothetical protein
VAIGDPFPKVRKGVSKGSKQQLAPVTRVTVARIKKRPRGRSFEKGNGFGSEHRFQKGMPSANPSGRPLCKEISKALVQRLASTGPISARSGAEKLANEWYKQASTGNVPALVSLANRVEGCPATAIQVTGQDNLVLLLEAMTGELGPPEARPLLEEGATDDDDTSEVSGRRSQAHYRSEKAEAQPHDAADDASHLGRHPHHVPTAGGTRGLKQFTQGTGSDAEESEKGETTWPIMTTQSTETAETQHSRSEIQANPGIRSRRNRSVTAG